MKKLLKTRTVAVAVACILFMVPLFHFNASAYGYGAYCQGIDWHDGNDRYKWIETSQSFIASLRCSQVTTTRYDTGSNALKALQNSEVFIVHSHGSQTDVGYQTADGQRTLMTTDMIDELPANAFVHLNLAFYGTCSAGQGGANAVNMVNATANRGAGVVIGFRDLTYVPQINQYLYDFLKSLGEKGNTYKQAMQDGLFWAKFWNFGDAGGTDQPYTRGDLNRTYPKYK